MPRNNKQRNAVDRREQNPGTYSQDPVVARKLELLRQVRVKRDGMLLNMGAILKGDPTQEYKWVNVREERQYYFQALGWQKQVNPLDPETGRPDDSVVTNFLKEDGTHVRADVILYHIDKDLAQALEADSVLKGVEAIEGSVAGFETVANLAGVPVYGEGVTTTSSKE